MNNPTADDLILLGAAQRNNQKRLDTLQHFTPKDVEDSVLNCHIWLPDEEEYGVSVDDLARLAFDIRIPPQWANFFQKLAQHGRDNGYKIIHPNNQPNPL